MIDRQRVLGELRRALEFYREIGVESVPVGVEKRIAAMLAEKGETKGDETKKGVSGQPVVTAPKPAPPPQPVISSCETPVERKTREKKLNEIKALLGDCQRCPLAAKRTHIVFGVGNPCAPLMFIGEGPGRDEDLQGLPFVGAAGELLTGIIKAMGYARDDVYIANIVKCRPPGNRDPEPDEVETCIPFLKKQIEAIEPRAIVALGRVAAQSLFKTEEKISKMRGNFRDYNGLPVMITFHPAYLLRNPKDKKVVWEDMKQVMRLLGKALPA